MKIAVISANLGSYDPPHPWPEYEQLTSDKGDADIDIIRLTDENFPPRPLAMTSRLQCAIPKMFGWQLFPGYDIYIWIDASMRPEPGAFMWLKEQLGHNEIALFKHPHRKTVKAEYEFIKAKMELRDKYLCSRYDREWLNEQAAVILGDPFFADERLYASTAFIYRNIEKVHRMMKDWWHHKTRYLLHDQLALPYVVWHHRLFVSEIKENIYKNPYFTYVRNKK